MTASNDTDVTMNMRMVYAALININDRHIPRTQKKACAILDMPSSTVSDQVNKLLRGHFLRSSKGAHAERADKTYVPGKNSGYIEELIRLDRLYTGEYFGNNGQGITLSECDYHVMTSRSHLNGGYVYFNVESEGILGKIRTFEQPMNRNVMMTLFSKKWFTKGSVPHYGNSLNLNGENFQIHYIVGKTKDRVKFGVCPPELIQTKDQTSEDLNPYVRQITPILAHLERYADWVFEKDELGNYTPYAAVKQEIGLDRTITTALDSIMGDTHGVVGVTPIHRDNSIPGGEWEVTGANSDYTAAEYFRAIANTPATERAVINLARSTEELQASIETKLNTVWVALDRIMDVNVAHTKVTEVHAGQLLTPVESSEGVMYR